MSFEEAVSLRDRLNAAREQGLSYEDAKEEAVSEQQPEAAASTPARRPGPSAEVGRECTASTAEAPATDGRATSRTGSLTDG